MIKLSYMSSFWQKLNKPSTFFQNGKSDVKSEVFALGEAGGHNFWKVLGKPIFCLAPMEEVTDFAFREMFARYSGHHPVSLREPPLLSKEGNAPQLSQNDTRRSPPIIGGVPRAAGGGGNSFVMYTEFINVDGLTHPEGRKNLAIDLKYSEIQRPIVAQIWGNSPAKFEEAAKIIVDLGFDGIDINMGCPQDKEIGIGACAALIREPKLAQEIISATKKAAGFLPVSVKTRLGYSKTDEMGDWVRNLLETNIAALTLHARTKQEKSKAPAHWEAIKEAVEIRDEMFPMNPHPSPSPRGRGKEVGLRPLIIGNGDIKSRQEGLERVAQTGCDGVMIGRGAFGNPWLFLADDYHPGLNERFRAMLEHAKLFQDTLGEHKSFFIMRKQFKTYCSGFNGAHELRAKLLNAKDLEEAEDIVLGYLERY